MVYEDFENDYTEVDPATYITLATVKATFTNLDRDIDAYVYKSFGAGHFGNFTHDFDFKVTAGAGDLAIVGGWVLTDTLDDMFANNDYISLWLEYASGSGNFRACLIEDDGSGLYADCTAWGAIVVNTSYYARVIKNGTSLKLGIYSTNLLRDAGDATDGDVDNLALTLHADSSFNYVGSCWSYNSSSAGREISGYVENLDLNEAPAPPTVLKGSIVPSVVTQLFSYTQGRFPPCPILRLT